MATMKRVERIRGIAVECFLPEESQYPAPLLFVHGSSGGSWIWANFLEYFSSRGFRSYALSLRGHHLSDPVEDWGAVGVDAYLEDVAKVVDWIGEDVVLIGHSMGGVLAQKHSETRNPIKLILLHTAPPRRVVQKIDFNAFLKRGKEKGRVLGENALRSDDDPQKLIGYMFDPGNVDDKTLEMTHKMLGEESARAVQEMKDVDVDAGKIRCPVYVLGFDLKKIGLDYPINLSKELATYYGARDYRVIEPGGHIFMLEKNWEEFAKTIEGWLRD